ncbi:MAG: A/G-specific adenine glycosylase [Alphaproteobacteria bacterium]|nr:A/G-specific adenine glycosylase [Alphaproteobacteria bacterium]
MVKISATLLAWYDRHARDLPWRVPPHASRAGRRADPYRVWLSEIMLQQTTVAAVKDYYHVFTSRWPDVAALAMASDDAVMAAWAGLGYYARARNLLKCARLVVADFDGVFPADRVALQGLPGIGPYTSAAISAIAFGRSEVVVDGNVERVMARLFAVKTPLPKAKPELVALADQQTPKARAGDYAQAVMDLGATICTPKKPACGLCPLREDCQAWAAGIAAQLPGRSPKPKKPTRFGIAYITRRPDGAFLLERRPAKGLLGGMMGWPGSDWGAHPEPAPPIEAEWQMPTGEVRHTFTHFHLILTIKVALVPLETVPARGQFVPSQHFHPGDLPTVMRKAYDLATRHLEKV